MIANNPTREDAEQAIRTLLTYIGENPNRPGLLDTPRRVVSAWEDEWGFGYNFPSLFDVGLADENGNFKLFKEDKIPSDMIVQRGISFSSHCEHHMAPFFGTANIAYIPTTAGVIGLSKLARIVALHAAKLQVQERLTFEIADFLATHVSADIAIVLRAQHTCMSTRGVLQQNTVTVTSALRGAFYDDQKTRAEFLALCRSA